MKNLFLFIFLISGISGYSQFFPVDTARLNNAYRIYSSEPDKYEYQLEFLEAFPSTFKEYTYTYGYFKKQTGYDLTQHFLVDDHVIHGLQNLDLIEDSIYCNKLIWLSLEGRLDFESSAYLQSLLYHTMKNRKEEMFKQLNGMVEGQQVSFWFFYYHERFKNRETEFNKMRSEMRIKYPKVVHSMEIAYPAAAGMVWY